MTTMNEITVPLAAIELGDEARPLGSNWKAVRDIVYHSIKEGHHSRMITVIFDLDSFCAFESSEITVRRQA